MTQPSRALPITIHVVIGQRMLCGEGPGAWRHELGVTLPEGQVFPETPCPLGEPGVTATWAEVEELPIGSRPCCE